MKKYSWKKTQASIMVTMVRDRKFWTTLRTNQIVGFVTVLTWKKINKQCSSFGTKIMLGYLSADIICSKKGYR